MAQTLFLLNPIKCGGANVLNLGDPTVCPTPPPPPTPAAAPPTSGGDPWWDRDKNDTDFLREVERIGNRRTELDPPGDDLVLPATPGAIRRNSFVHAINLAVDIYATFLKVTVVERGNLVHFFATFSDEPDEVHFSYIKPGEDRPHVDTFGQPGSCISRVLDTTFSMQLDTTGFAGGDLDWHFWSVGPGQASAFGNKDSDENRVVIPHRKPQLL
jgi:hypothetical protein